MKVRKLKHFHLGGLRRIIKLRCQDQVPNTETMERKSLFSSYNLRRQLQDPWRGHLVRMDDERLPERYFYGDISEGSYERGVKCDATMTLGKLL
ncbi:unnamed protein product [Schistocephalus solidus]|uniref:Uncharacterized protein n=1 Tax=Schistocephalus solidus TaxID=70667 RepID=A0A183SVH7_SCHSO|nr:unnamed protein product [Schistocephalus solidus]